MLRTENEAGGTIHQDLSTTKTDKTSHGFGLSSMREIAQRYHGTLDAGMENGRFVLVVCLLI